METAILFNIWIRTDLAKEVFSQIRKVKPKRLYIAIDGPRNAEDKKLIEKTKNIVKVDWDCNVKYLIREKNLGCDKAIPQAISWLFENEEMGIILEDDCYPDLSFFRFCEELLTKYKDDTRIMHIAGRCNSLNKEYNQYSYYFQKGMDCWGWASWKRAWKYYDNTMPNLKLFEKEKAINKYIINYTERERLSEIFKLPPIKVLSWDYIYSYNLYCQNAICINPSVNLVKNIGMISKYATHKQENVDKIYNKLHEMQFPLKHPIFIGVEPEYNENNIFIYYKSLVIKLIKRFFQLRISNIFSVKNEYCNNTKNKVIRILGIKIKFKVKGKKNE